MEKKKQKKIVEALGTGKRKCEAFQKRCVKILLFFV